MKCSSREKEKNFPVSLHIPYMFLCLAHVLSKEVL